MTFYYYYTTIYYYDPIFEPGMYTVPRHYVCLLDSTVTSCMTPDKLFNICMLQFPPWYS